MCAHGRSISDSWTSSLAFTLWQRPTRSMSGGFSDIPPALYSDLVMLLKDSIISSCAEEIEFTNLATNVTFEAESSALIPCSATGRPTPEMSWRFHSRKIAFGKFAVTNCFHGMIVFFVYVEHQCYYACIIVTGQVLVTVKFMSQINKADVGPCYCPKRSNYLQYICYISSVVVNDLRLKDEDKDKESSFKENIVWVNEVYANVPACQSHGQTPARDHGKRGRFSQNLTGRCRPIFYIISAKFDYNVK